MRSDKEIKQMALVITLMVIVLVVALTGLIVYAIKGVTI